MNNIFLTTFAFKGVKNVDKMVDISFYKKIIRKIDDTQIHNMKGIYGMNGAGKTAVITAVNIFRNLLVDASYLNNSIVQQKLNGIVNKNLNSIVLEAEYVTNITDSLELYKYTFELNKNAVGNYAISFETLSKKKASSTKDFEPIYVVNNGELTFADKYKKDKFGNEFIEKTKNLLESASVSSLYFERIAKDETYDRSNVSELIVPMGIAFILGNRISVYLDASDEHMEYVLNNMLNKIDAQDDVIIDNFNKYINALDKYDINSFSEKTMSVYKLAYDDFCEKVNRLSKFIKVFKPDLIGIDIDKREDKDFYNCNLIMQYDSYEIDAEYESTGIKKLIRLFAFVNEMANGGIVFIDELDSNLHDVYLCALIEYLMLYGKGQMCFTTHNIGPMDVLRQNKKSIDFLSDNHSIYSWKSNGNYSPANLYRKGMIEGSPFNIDSIDFIGIFDSDGDA